MARRRVVAVAPVVPEASAVPVVVVDDAVAVAAVDAVPDRVAVVVDHRAAMAEIARL